MSTTPYGFRILGPTFGERQLTGLAAAFGAYCTCNPSAHTSAEGFLSAFSFPDEFALYLRANHSVKGYSGSCGALHLWVDIDRLDDLTTALDDARRVRDHLLGTMALDPKGLLVFFSGSKGFHIGISTSAWMPEPSDRFHNIAKAVAFDIGERAGVRLDPSVYDRVRAFRAPNSRHPATGLHKRILDPAQLDSLRIEDVLELARSPVPFEPIYQADPCQALHDLWDHHEREPSAWPVKGVAVPIHELRITRATHLFLLEGALDGHRNTKLFSAAANLGEFGCPPELAWQLLGPPALACGLPEDEVRQTIAKALDHAARQMGVRP